MWTANGYTVTASRTLARCWCGRMGSLRGVRATRAATHPRHCATCSTNWTCVTDSVDSSRHVRGPAPFRLARLKETGRNGLRKLIMWNLMTLNGCFEGAKAWELQFH